MLIKNFNAFDFTHKQKFKTLTRDNLGGEPLYYDKSGGGHFAHFQGHHCMQYC